MKNIEVLASALESLGYNKEAAEIRKVAGALAVVGIVAGIIAVIGAIAGIANLVYKINTQNVDPNIAEDMTQKAQDLAKSFEKISDNWWGAKVRSNNNWGSTC